jgi:hypothetical protein
MNDIFVPYQEALALKELGFDEPCLTYYFDTLTDIVLYPETQPGSGFSLKGFKNSHKKFQQNDCVAPLYQQAFKWFRDNYKLQHKIWSGKISTVFYGYDIINIEKQEFVINNTENGGGDCDYNNYEEAELECLKKLIEIVKSKS